MIPAECQPRDEEVVSGQAEVGNPVHLDGGLREERGGRPGLPMLDHAHQRRGHGHAQVKNALTTLTKCQKQRSK